MNRKTFCTLVLMVATPAIGGDTCRTPEATNNSFKNCGPVLPANTTCATTGTCQLQATATPYWACVGGARQLTFNPSYTANRPNPLPQPGSPFGKLWADASTWCEKEDYCQTVCPPAGTTPLSCAVDTTIPQQVYSISYFLPVLGPEPARVQEDCPVVPVE